jgi:hypothetical protein
MHDYAEPPEFRSPTLTVCLESRATNRPHSDALQSSWGVDE